LWALNRMGGGKLVGDMYDKASSGLGSLYNSAQTMYNNYTAPADTSSGFSGGYGGDN
jgi:hypothetical protein